MYITEEKRDQLNPLIESLLDKLSEFQLDDLSTDDLDANVEFIFATILTQLYAGDETRVALGILNNVSQEYFRRVGAPYYVQQSFDLGETFELPPMDLIETPSVDVIKAGGSD